MTGLLGTLAIPAAAIGVVLVSYWHARRRELVMVKRWAERSKVELLEFRPRSFAEPAPFSFWMTHRQPNYFVKVRDGEGRVRSAWLRLGTLFESIYWSGKNNVEVRWEESN
jgi:hypothetical protein